METKPENKMDINDVVAVPRNMRHIIPYETASIKVLRHARRQAQFVVPHLFPKAFYRNCCAYSCALDSALKSIKNPVALKLFLALRHDGFRQKLHDDYVHLEPNGNISFVQHPTDKSDSWPECERTTMRAGRFVRRFLRPWVLCDISDEQIKEFVTQLKARAKEKDIVIQRISVQSAYSWRYCMFESCMQLYSVWDFYRAIGVHECITARQGDALLGRALIWENSNLIPGCAGFVDRIYGDGEVQILLKKWARDNNFAYKERQASDCYNLVLPDGTVQPIDFVWPAKLPEGVFWPFVDTMHCYNKARKVFFAPGKTNLLCSVALRSTPS